MTVISERRDNMADRKKFRSVVFDFDKKVMEILDGSKGTYSFKDIVRATVLNEKAKYHNKTPHFTALIPHGPLPQGLLQNPYLYVGIEVVLSNGSILAIYISQTQTVSNSEQYIHDREEAEKIHKIILRIIENNK